MNKTPTDIEDTLDDFAPFEGEEERIVPVIIKKMGRPKNKNYLSYKEAMEFMHSEQIPSKGKFDEWWQRNKPKAIPRFPYRIYKEEWTSWNDFLGNDNKFQHRPKENWRPLVEAALWVHNLSLKSQGEWLEWCKTSGQLPADIPTRPDLIYNDWRSWGHWLGNRPVAALQVKQEAQKIQVYYIIHEPDHPANILTFGVEAAGLTAMKQRWEYEKFDIVRLFWYDPQKSDIINKVISLYSTPYQGYDSLRIVPNVWQIVELFEQLMDVIRKPSVVELK